MAITASRDNPIVRRVVAVWLLLASVATAAVLVLEASRDARVQAATSDATAVAAQAAGLTSIAFQEQLDLARHTAETVLAGDVTTELLERGLLLVDGQALGVFDADRRVVLGIALPGYSLDEDIDLDTILEYFPGAEAALQGNPVIDHAANLAEGITLVTLFVPYAADDGSRRVVATGVLLDESVYAPLLSAGAGNFTIEVTDTHGNLLLRSGPKVTVPDVDGRSAIPGTIWVVEARATWAQLRNGLASIWSRTATTILLAALAVLVLGLLATRAIRTAARVEAAYEQVAWAAHQQREFIAIVAHELRTPATSASGLAGFLHTRWDTLDAERRRDLAQRVAASTQDLARLVSDLRLSQGFASGPIALAPTSRRVANLLTGAITASGVDESLIARSGDLETTVIVDDRFATRALSSLILNGATHGRPPIDITVETRPGEVSVTIRDHGDGVPDNFAPLLFEPFTQARSHLRRSHRGTGLGLHLVQAIVEQMGGSVEYLPAAPGAAFTIRLPRAEGDREGDDRPA